MEVRVAMIIYGDAYSKQSGGSMDFWDSLGEYNKRICRMVIELFQNTPPPTNPEE
jgi:hypothetical protein